MDSDIFLYVLFWAEYWDWRQSAWKRETTRGITGVTWWNKRQETLTGSEMLYFPLPEPSVVMYIMYHSLIW